MMADFDEISLPSIVQSDGDSDYEIPTVQDIIDSGLDVPLPDDCCKCRWRRCSAQVADHVFASHYSPWLQTFLKMKQHERKAEWLRLMQLDSPTPEDAGQKSTYSLFGYQFCSPQWRKLTSCHADMFRNLRRHLSDGSMSVAPDARSQRTERATPVRDDVDSWFQVLYASLAEFRPEPGASEDASLVDMLDGQQQLSELFEWNVVADPRRDLSLLAGVRARDAAKPDEKRELPHMAFDQLYEFYTMHSSDPSSKSHFHRIWKSGWYRCLPIRPPTKHSPCTDCAKYKKQRQKAKTKEEAAEIARCMNDHLRGACLDRNCASRLEAAAEATAQGLCADVGQDAAFIYIDGMDISRFKCPRFQDSGKAMQECWRPNLHFTGCIVAGVAEIFEIAEPDVEKSSCSTLDSLMRALDVLAKKCDEKSVPIPQHLYILVGNAARDNRNSYVVSFVALLVASSRFRSTSLLFFLVGHTHNRMDQRLGEINKFRISSPRDKI